MNARTRLPVPPNALHAPFVHDAFDPHWSNEVHGAPSARTAVHFFDVLSQKAFFTQPEDCVAQSPPIAMRATHFFAVKSHTALSSHWNWKSVPQGSPTAGIFSHA